MPIAPVVTTISIILSSNKIQNGDKNGDILVLANLGSTGKMAVIEIILQLPLQLPGAH